MDTPDSFWSRLKLKQVTLEYYLILISENFMPNIPTFFFLFLIGERIDLAFFSKVNAQLFIGKRVTYIGEIFREFFFYLLWIFMLIKSSAQRNRSQSTSCGILLMYSKNKIGARMDFRGTQQMQCICYEHLHKFFYWIGMF